MAKRNVPAMPMTMEPYEYPHCGSNGHETEDGLRDRNPEGGATERGEAQSPYTPMHMNRTRCTPTEASGGSLKEGVTFRKAMRSDLDEDVLQW